MFNPIYASSSIIIPYSLIPYDICIKYPIAWKYLKSYIALFYFSSSIICSNSLFILLFKNKLASKNISNQNLVNPKQHKSELLLFIGSNENKNLVFIPEKSLYQNILITGTIGSGKTSSCMYPFSKQLIQYKCNDHNEKLGMLILDVKGNFYSKILEYARNYNRTEDVCVISLDRNIKYNPLDKPHLKATVLADRLKTILTLFSNNNSDSYWLDKAQQVISECIKLCRLYNDGYVTFLEIHKLVTVPNYYMDKVDVIKEKFVSR